MYIHMYFIHIWTLYTALTVIGQILAICLLFIPITFSHESKFWSNCFHFTHIAALFLFVAALPTLIVCMYFEISDLHQFIHIVLWYISYGSINWNIYISQCLYLCIWEPARRWLPSQVRDCNITKSYSFSSHTRSKECLCYVLCRVNHPLF